MKESRVKISSIVENQLPQFVREEFPLVSEFLSQYYTSLESPGGVNDILENIDQYIKVDELTNLTDYTVLTSNVSSFDTSINTLSTYGFPEEYGLLLIDSEIITYTSKTDTTFDGCIRGFVGNTSYKLKDELVFSDSEVDEHSVIVDGFPNKVSNLSILFLKEFLNKIKKQFTPGFEDRELYSELNERLFIKQSIDFYSSKGTDNSFKILFGVLYGEDVEVIKPRDYLIRPSDAQYRITSDLVVESIDGNPEELVNRTLYQDESEFINSSQGTVTKVEKIIRNNKNYYILSVDSDYNKDIGSSGSIYGEFSIHPKTKTISSSSTDLTTLYVDSTVAFPQKDGNLLIELDNGVTLNVTYKSKNLNQFIDCSGIVENIPENTEIKLNTYAYGYGTDGLIKVRITGVLSELNIPQETKLYSKGDTIRIKTLGVNSNDISANNWFFNIPVKYDVKNIELLDSSDRSYKIELFYNHSFRVGDFATLISSNGIYRDGYIVSYLNEKAFSIQFGSETDLLDTDLIYTIKKNILKVSSENYPEVNKYMANVQNVYLDNENNLYISSPSIPSYLNRPLKINDRSIIFSGTFEGETLNLGKSHGFYTGDSVVYKPTEQNSLGISSGIYFIKKISDTEIKLSRSRSNIFTNNFVSVNGTVIDAKIELARFTYSNLDSQKLESQKLLRNISTPENDDVVHETSPGLTGIFINGVELLNYKSNDLVYYGPLEKIDVIASGEKYDVINPPTLSISDLIGYGATAQCSVIGSLERIDVINPGFDYLEQPIIQISGGNGFGASAKVNLISFDHSSTFNAKESANTITLNPTNTIRFSNYHNFRDYEEVIYITNGDTPLGGLVSNSSYFVSIQDDYTLKLHNSFTDSVLGINTVQITSYGTGNQTFKSKNKKKKVGSITIENPGYGYEKKLTTIPSSGINTIRGTIEINNHGYNSGEVIVYHATDISVGGLSSARSYYVTRVNDNEIKLSEIGISSLGITTTFYYDTNQYIGFSSQGSGNHKFSYPEISVLIKGRTGISSASIQNYNAELRPVFRGSVNSVFLVSGGNSYGSEEILNYNRQPSFTLSSGSGIELSPIILNGSIVDVIIESSGSGYDSVPDITINGDGFGAVLVPIFSNGSLSQVNILSGGIGYKKENTSIIVTQPGYGAKFESKIKSWRINLVERLILNSQIPNDDGILSSGLNNDYGLEYTHAYAPRHLRSSVQSSLFKDGQLIYVSDLQLFNNKEQTSNAHSPIIGWAYDGNPIYGPYGYASKLGGAIKNIRTSYKLNEVESDQRPNISLYPYGFFVEDYVYTGEGDLDEYNGRFCITPEYPNGIYAYFATINPDYVETSGPFTNYKKPAFPYAIGDKYKSKPIEFNFISNSNQDYINLNQTTFKRNTTPYGILDNPNSYEFLFNPNNIKNQNSIVRTAKSGTIDKIKIISGGDNYKVNDRIVFESDNNYLPKAKVSLIGGKKVTQVSVSSSTFDNVELYRLDKEFIGFVTVPHNYKNNDLVTITGTYDYRKNSNITLVYNDLLLTSGVGSAQYTGLVTYFNITGNLDFPNISENDIYEIENEQIKILNIDPELSRIRVLRNQNGTVGIVSYTSGSILREKSRKFRINFGISSSYNFNYNREYYFDPKESIGLGTYNGVGITSTIYFSTPGIGITQLTLPTQTIFIKNHNLNTGDSLTYSSNGGTTISVSTDGYSEFQLQENSLVYVAKISEDLIGISTIKTGINSTGNYTNNILFFTSLGIGNTHSFKTNYDVFTAQVSKKSVKVATAETHGLSLLDEIFIDVTSGISTTITIKYDDVSRRVLIDPRTFDSINLSNSSIIIENHKYYTGQKVLYTSDAPAIGLESGKLYYIIVVNSNTFKLSETYYDSQKNNGVVISSSSSGTISQINPPIRAIKNQTISFDLSDSSLAFTNNFISYSAFDLRFFHDIQFKNEFESTLSSPSFEVVRIGRIGIDTDAKVILTINEKVPNILYYNLIPVNLSLNTQVKKDIFCDDGVINHNKISINQSKYSGRFNVVDITPDTFTYNIFEEPEVLEYTNNVEYATSSITANGEIKNILLENKGKNYKSLVGISSIITTSGSNSILEPETTSIGQISSIEIQDIGFDYSSDYTTRPTVKFPDILILESLSSFDKIKISSYGKNYNSDPSLVVVDSLTNKIIDDVDLRYTSTSNEVEIIRNSFKISSISPKIIPTNNTNGVKISYIEYDNLTKNVTVTLGSEFSSIDDFPFFVGEKVLVEGISVGITTSNLIRGYNSSEYEYALFEIVSIDPNIGGIGATVSYNMSSYLKTNESIGIFNEFNSSGRIIPQSQFPTFSITLKKNDFYNGETVYSGNSYGIIENWDEKNQQLKVSTTDTFDIGSIIVGKTSSTSAIIKEVITYESDYSIGPTSLVRKGWETQIGFLNNDFQRIHDNDYYQYFSYALKSHKDFSTWNDAVSSLNHTSGFKKFSNLILESEQSNIGISTEQDNGDFSGVANLYRLMNINCVSDFDLVRENNLNINSSVKSDEVVFNSRIIQDYIESIGNRVLLIDNISDQFNSNPRSTQFSIVDTFNLSDAELRKYIIVTQDKKYVDEKQITLITLIHDEFFGYLNQYGMESLLNLGFFDFNISGNSGNLLFYPLKFKLNDYHLSVFSFSLNNITSLISPLLLGDSALIHTNNIVIPEGTNTQTTIVGIASTYRSSKIIVEIDDLNSDYKECTEITYIHDGTNVYTTEYGQLNTQTTQSISNSGICSYYAYISGTDVLLDVIPYSNLNSDYNINCFIISLSDSNVSGVGTTALGGSLISSSSISIASSSSPTENKIASYLNTDYISSYCVISIEDKTNGEYKVSEFLSLSNSDTSYDTEFGMVYSNSTLGIISTDIVGDTTEIYFTPNQNIELDVKILQINIGILNENSNILLNNGSINYTYSDYLGTDNDIKKDFELTHKNYPIFKRIFNSQSSSIVNPIKDTIRIPNHFYVTGEEIEYSYLNSELNSTNAIGIATTSISGIGITDKLPTKLYVVKVNDLDIKVAASATDALKEIPNVLDITSVGIGTSQSFISKKQNEKSLISIDNVIQSPIVSTSVTTILSKSITPFETQIFVSGITSIYGGDLIKIDNEIMRVNSVGIGSTNSLIVNRPLLGSSMVGHSTSSLVSKIKGNYNIVGNRIYFSDPPYGKIPFSNISNRPDEIDYIGITTSSKFNGRIFLRSGILESYNEPYETNYIFDDISSEFDGKNQIFTLKNNSSDITGISTDNAILTVNSIFQGPDTLGDYTLDEVVGVTSISFTGSPTSNSYDVNTSSIPRGGVILSIGSSNGFGYQPLVSAGGTAIVSVGGSIQAISIGNSGSGYREGLQTVNVSVKTESVDAENIEIIGIATVVNGNITGVSIINPGSGYTSTNPPVVIFDSPLSYSNIPLIYSEESASGFGTGAVIDIVVGQGSSVISFELKNLGYGYRQNDILTVSIGGTTGIPTTSSPYFSEFKIYIDSTFSDNFSGWTVGNLQIIESIDSLFDGVREEFPIIIDGNQTTIRSKKGSNIEVKATLLVFLNDVLQVPDEGYIFNGGSTILFTEPPKQGDRCKLLFYRGTGDVDTKLVDIMETIKVGDGVTLTGDDIFSIENQRITSQIVSSDIINTNIYPGPGISHKDTYKSLEWCRQTEDTIIEGKFVAKDRILYEAYIQPSSYAINSIGIASTEIFVESIKTFFDSEREYIHDGTNEKPQNKIIIISQDSIVTALASANVSISGTISGVDIIESGSGYTNIPSISISNPISIGSSGAASLTCSILNGQVTSVNILDGGSGYDSSYPPQILFETPSTKYEIIDNVGYEGDFGIIVGIDTTSVGIASTGIILDLFVPFDSPLRDSDIVKVGVATTGISGISTGYYFIISRSNVGNGLTSLNGNGDVIGIGTTNIDNVYQVASVSIAQTTVLGVGLTNVTRVIVNVSSFNGLTGIETSGYYGEYSWGRISTTNRIDPKEFSSYTINGKIGISTSPIIQRFNRLKYIGYSTA